MTTNRIINQRGIYVTRITKKNNQTNKNFIEIYQDFASDFKRVLIFGTGKIDCQCTFIVMVYCTGYEIRYCHVHIVLLFTFTMFHLYSC